jgi:hypothetical protein
VRCTTARNDADAGLATIALDSGTTARMRRKRHAHASQAARNVSTLPHRLVATRFVHKPSRRLWPLVQELHFPAALDPSG